MNIFEQYKVVNELLKSKEQVVFYAESRHYYQYYEQLITGLQAAGISICYITSDAKDPLLTQSSFKVIYVKLLLGFLFPRIRAKVLIMTMPDLGNYLYKRSSQVDKYVYVFHAAVSTHQQYTKTAFFNYDAIFCTGEYQIKEIRATEKLYNTKQKDLIPYGYPLFDKIRRSDSKNILIAPSWYPGCIFDTCIKELLEQLPDNVILRSHPEYEKRKKKGKYPDVSIDTNPDVIQSLNNTGILITDRSGIAFEFAVGAGKPVLFIDTALKEMNKDWRDLGIEPVENSFRSQMGLSVSPNDMNLVPQKIKELESFDMKLRKDLFFDSYNAGVDYILTSLSASSR